MTNQTPEQIARQLIDQKSPCLVVAERLIELLTPVEVFAGGLLHSPRCPACKAAMAPIARKVHNYCSNCGRRIIWI